MAYLKGMKTFKVYHKIELEYRILKEAPTLIDPKEYRLVAVVAADDLEEVFKLTNHIDSYWWENNGVIKVCESRSTSMGDIVEEVSDESIEKLFLCMAAGWEIVGWEGTASADDDFFNEMVKPILLEIEAIKKS